MYSYLVKKPSADRVKDIITKSVSIEQVRYTLLYSSAAEWIISGMSVTAFVFACFSVGVSHRSLTRQFDRDELLSHEAIHWVCGWPAANRPRIAQSQYFITIVLWDLSYNLYIYKTMLFKFCLKRFTSQKTLSTSWSRFHWREKRISSRSEWLNTSDLEWCQMWWTVNSLLMQISNDELQFILFFWTVSVKKKNQKNKKQTSHIIFRPCRKDMQIKSISFWKTW